MGRKISNRKKIADLVWECYRELYRESTPSADFDSLVENAPTNDRGEKEVDYMAYYLSQEKYTEIVAKYLDMISDKSYYKSGFRFEMALGCSPTCAKEQWEYHLEALNHNDKDAIDANKYDEGRFKKI